MNSDSSVFFLSAVWQDSVQHWDTILLAQPERLWVSLQSDILPLLASFVRCMLQPPPTPPTTSFTAWAGSCRVNVQQQRSQRGRRWRRRGVQWGGGWSTAVVVGRVCWGRKPWNNGRHGSLCRQHNTLTLLVSKDGPVVAAAERKPASSHVSQGGKSSLLPDTRDVMCGLFVLLVPDVSLCWRRTRRRWLEDWGGGRRKGELTWNERRGSVNPKILTRCFVLLSWSRLIWCDVTES